MHCISQNSKINAQICIDSLADLNASMVSSSYQDFSSQEIHPACPQVRSIQHNGLCLDLLESICKSVNLF